MKEKNRVLNDDIRASKVQLITDEGENLGEMTIDEARSKAESEGLDLMEMSNNGNFSVIKMLDYGKFLYRQKKNEQKNKAKGKAPDLKTLRITFKIGDHDLEIRRKQAAKFAEAHHPLKISLMLSGRENHYGDLAMEKMKSFVESLDEIYKLEGEVKRSGNMFTAMMKIRQK